MSRVRGICAFLAGACLSLVAGWLVFPSVLYDRIPQPLNFSHRTHTGEKGGMTCEDCHGFSPEGRFAGVPPMAKCAECHQEPLGTTPEEKTLVEEYVKAGREIPWRIYSRQPDNVSFSHAVHVKRGGLSCERCHGSHGRSAVLAPYEENRISGYSRSIWGHSLSRVGLAGWEGKKMTDCDACHRRMGRQDSCLDCHK